MRITLDIPAALAAAVQAEAERTGATTAAAAIELLGYAITQRAARRRGGQAVSGRLDASARRKKALRAVQIREAKRANS